MKTPLKKTLLAVVPLAGLLLVNAPAFAHGDEQQGHSRDRWGNLHQQEHQNLHSLHQEFHEQPYSKWEHRRFHRWLNRDHRDFHNDLYSWRRNDNDRDWRWGRRYSGDYGRGQYGSPWSNDYRLPWWRR